MQTASRSGFEPRIRRAAARPIATRALVRPMIANDSRWPPQLRYAFIVGATGLLWSAIYGVSLTLI